MATPNSKGSDPVFEVVDTVLTQILGERAAQMIYRHLENRYALRQSEFSAKVDLLAKGLEGFLQNNAFLVERRILREIYLRQGIAFEADLAGTSEKRDFASQVRIALQKA